MEKVVGLDEISILGLTPAIKNLGKNLVGCEIGVRQGYSMRYLFDHVPCIKLMYGIDPWRPYQDWSGEVTQEMADEWRREAFLILREFKDRIRIAQTTSHQANVMFQPKSLDFIFIDGDHSYENVLRDLKLYYPKMKKGALFGGHDYSLKSVKMAVDNFRKNHNIENDLQLVDNDAWYWYI